MISVDIQHLVRAGPGSFQLDLQIDSSARRIALFGPSGSGKTLTMQAIAGLFRPESGHLRIGEETLFDSGRGIFVDARKRRLGYVQQDYALFPHLTVAQNIAFGLKRGWRNPGAVPLPPAASHWVEAFSLAPVLQSYPAELSGGQKQRVAMARALSVAPRLLLLDEPLSALDADLRKTMRRELVSLQRGLDVPTILITHDPEDALLLADRVFYVREGRIVKEGEPAALLDAQSSTPSITLEALKMA